MTPKTDNLVTLKDGRQISYAEFGDPQGKPVLHFHGTPSSRFEGSRPSIDETAKQLAVRLILPDRPGFGMSDFQPRRSFLDWTDDVLELVAALEIDKFAVMGLSGGSPYVAACAYKISDRLTAAGIISGISPLDAPGAFDGMAKSDRLTYELARKAPWLLRLLFWYMAGVLNKEPQKAISQMMAELSPPDQAALRQSDVQETFIKMARAAFQQGSRGVTWEYRLFTRPWGFQLEKISMPVNIWHGESDSMCPHSMGRYLATTIPHSQAKFFPNEGHVSLIVNRYAEMLSMLLQG
ncbi:MAG: alpha/beta hydrolase [Anaerolineales bacterium]|nr:alpha/beta hydrolase [Anaerolineales bacterium]